jgi:regulator of replication initiation timing
MSDIVEPLKLPLHPIIRTRLIKLMGENETLQYEIEKLRAALRKLYDHEGERVLNSIGIECYTEELEDALCEARAALGEKE